MNDAADSAAPHNGEAAFSDEQPPTRATSWRGNAVRAVLMGVVLIFVGLSLTSAWSDVRADLSQLTWQALGVSTAALCAGFGLLFAAWYRILGALGRPDAFSVRDGAEVYSVGQLGKYVPGAVWPVLIQTEMGARRNVGWRLMVGAYTILILLSLTTGSAAALGTLAGPIDVWVRWVIVGGAVCGVLITWATVHPDALHRQLDRLLIRFTGGGFPDRLNGKATAEAAALCFGAWLCFGVHAAAILYPLGVTPSDFVFVGGSFVFAWVAGIAAIPIPAGFGVREAVLILTVGQLAGRPTAITLAFVSRLLQVIVDLVVAGSLGAGGAFRRRSVR